MRGGRFEEEKSFFGAVLAGLSVGKRAKTGTQLDQGKI